MDMLPSQRWHCSLVSFPLFLTALCSTLFILNMTFGRFYSIIRPHKAASFNSVKRAKVTIVCIVLFSIIYNLPHLFTTAVDGRTCKPSPFACTGVLLALSFHSICFTFSFFVDYELCYNTHPQSKKHGN